MVWRLDRLGRSLKHLIETVSALHERKIGFKSITENIDTTTSGGKLIFHVFGALAEFERDLIRERTQAGLLAARARGRPICQPSGKSKWMAAIIFRDAREPGHAFVLRPGSAGSFHFSESFWKYFSIRPR